MAPIPVIGLGAICAAGATVDKAYDAVLQGIDGLSPLSLFDSGLKENPLCGQVVDDVTTVNGIACPNRIIGLALHAIQEALQVLPDRKNIRMGLTLATTVAGITESEIFYRRYLEDPAYVSQAGKAVMYHEPAAVTGYCARTAGAQGFFSLSTACSTGLHAIGMAKRLIEQNEYDICLAVGVDALSLLTVRGFASLMLIDFSGCKPFDKRRVGISLGEGAGAMLLASPRICSEYGVKPLAQISGWGASADGHHMTAPHPDGDGACAAAFAALLEAGITPDHISMIAAHGTATPDNDIAEIKAMRRIFNPLVPFCSMKRALGHTLAASGTLEAVFSIKALHNETIPATGGFQEPDDTIDAVPSPGEKKELKHILKNSFGFGGNNSSMVISRAGS